IHGKELAFKLRSEVDEDIRARKAETARKEAAAQARDEQLERRTREAQKRDEELGRRDRQLAQKEQSAEAAARQAEQALAGARERIEKIAAMTAAEARQLLVEQMTDEARKLAAGEIKKIESQAREEAAEKA